MKESLCLIVVYLVTVALSANFDEIEPKQATPNYRLPTVVLPLNYDIQIEPIFAVGPDQFNFNGLAIITLYTAQTGVNQIILHMNGLLIDEQATGLAPVSNPNANLTLGTAQWDSVTHKYTVTTLVPLDPIVQYRLSFKYTGILSDDMRGFYKSSYIENGVTKWLGTTQMQPTHARRVFPCFDEPGFKATFDIKILRGNTYATTVSNTDRLTSTPQNDGLRTLDVFRQTPKMSTYLVAFIVSEFAVRNTSLSFRVLARPDAFEQTRYAHEVGPRILARLDSYMGYPYATMTSMNKMDLAALPDFSAGAMENWGLLTFRETALLYDENVSTYLAQQRVATVIAHEQAHMWFGDLVTCDWWSYTWLNEGFARYFQYFGTALEIIDWDLPDQFIVEQLQAVMVMDSLETSHPMTNEVNTPTEISGIFDNISYNKGASVIRMIEHIMGATNFKTALQEYLRANEYSTGTPQKLYTSLQQRVSQNILNVAQFLNTWTMQTGYPVVTVNRAEDGRLLTVSQKRFLLKSSNHTDPTQWELKLNFATSDTKNFQATQSILSMPQSATTLNHSLASSVDWVIFNVQQTGYYRVNYDTTTWRNIERALKAVNHSSIHVLNRAQIVDDALSLARGDLLDYKLALSILQYIEQETNYLPWLAAFNNLIYVQRRFTATQISVYQNYTLQLMNNIYNTLGFADRLNDTRLDVYNRANILSYACKFGHEGCIESARIEFDKLVQATTTHRIPVNIRPVVYCTAITVGDESTWNFMWNRFESENVAAEQVVILTALGCTKNPVLLEGYMTRIISNNSRVRLQDKSAAFTSTYNNHDENVQTVLDFVIRNYLAIQTSFGSITDVATILSNLAARFTTQLQITQLENFYRGKELEFGSQTIPNAVADAKFNLEWSNNHIPEIYDYMASISGASRLVSMGLLLTILALISPLFH